MADCTTLGVRHCPGLVQVGRKLLHPAPAGECEDDAVPMPRVFVQGIYSKNTCLRIVVS